MQIHRIEFHAIVGLYIYEPNLRLLNEPRNDLIRCFKYPKKLWGRVFELVARYDEMLKWKEYGKKHENEMIARKTILRDLNLTH